MSDINIISPEAYEKIIYDWNATAVVYPKEETVVSLFEAQVKATPTQIALVFEDEQVIVSTNRGEPLTLGESGSPAARAYNNIARRLQGEDIALMDPSEARKGFRDRVRRLMQTRLF